MLRLLYFVPCEKMINAENGQVSLISVFENITVARQSSFSEMPSNSAYPLNWTGVACWSLTEKIEDSFIFESKLEIFDPEAMPTKLKIEHQFDVSPSFKNFRNHFNFPLFPIAKEGVYNLVLSIRQKGEVDWRVDGEYPIVVSFQRLEQMIETEKQPTVEE